MLFAQVQLPILKAPGFASVRNPGLLHALKDRIELTIANGKSLVVRLEGVGVVDAHGCEITHRPKIIEAKNPREETRRSFLVHFRYNRVI
jgi:hypothetical protein